MSVLDRDALDASPLADLHAIASELSIDGYRRLRRPRLIDAILDKQSGVEPSESSESSASSEPAETTEATETPEADSADEADEADEERSSSRRRRGRRGGRGRASSSEERAEAPADEPEEAEAPEDETEAEAEAADDEATIEGVVELLANGSGFVRVSPPEPSDEDVYISSAQVKRCELVSGDRIAGPKRAPRRSERFASLIRIETINGRPASELADSVRFDDLPATFPTDHLTFGSEDTTLKTIEWLTPFGKGSRVAIVGESRSGKSQVLRELADALADRQDLTVQVILAGVRPEEITEWGQAKVLPLAAVSFAASEDAQNGVIEPVIDQARRLAARGSDCVVLIDSLDGCSPQLARKAMASARNIVDGGSLTVVATAGAPIGGETTVVALDLELTSVGRFPALDVFASGTMHPERLVGQSGADAIARMRAEASRIAAE
jgi:transcription termination factor Rho